MNPLLNFINKIPRIHYPEKVRTEFIVEGVKTLTKKNHILYQRYLFSLPFYKFKDQFSS